jgi:LmbE family N-acetylglucosaminyl deacetylase
MTRERRSCGAGAQKSDRRRKYFFLVRLDFTSERVLAIVAHPDDAELLCAGTLARAAADGAAIGVCVLCAGDKGVSSEPVANLATVRRREATAAAKLLGCLASFAGFPDGELADGPRQRRTLLRLVRAFAPTLVLAHAPEDYHPDHRAAAALADAVSWFAASRGHVTRDAPLPAPPALWRMDTVAGTDFLPGFFVDISGYVDIKHRMLRCHASQMRRDRDSDFAPLEELMRRQYAARGDQCGVTAAEAFRIERAFKRARPW